MSERTFKLCSSCTAVTEKLKLCPQVVAVPLSISALFPSLIECATQVCARHMLVTHCYQTRARATYHDLLCA